LRSSQQLTSTLFGHKNLLLAGIDMRVGPTMWRSHPLKNNCTHHMAAVVASSFSLHILL
jgi:hypothetical protein